MTDQYLRYVTSHKGYAASRKHKHTEQTALQMLDRAGAIPLEPYPFSLGKPWKCQCKQCGEVISPLVGNIDRGSRACKFCYGTKACGDKPAKVYLIQDSESGAIKVGVTHAKSQRAKKDFPRWNVLEDLLVPTGRLASEIEAEIIRIWREELGLGPKLSRGDLNNKGYTETADESGLAAAMGVLGRHKQAVC